ncbi:hypothetical protein DSO57_1036658 [Entomophthora muscae]|uniref:Uncharacterized protein n=1 Tax=Entomophthora muscae TaxID=34485 RepID=A0ACC2RQD3_9FUNG|nr:hypothetical protein DSO57_1036658 [Entomophthora muscae]
MFKVSKDGQGSILLSASACDQCNRKRVRCNKHLPACHACLEFNLKCTRNRKLKTKPKVSYENVEKFKFSVRRVVNRPVIDEPGWGMVMAQWAVNSHQRLYFHYFTNFLGIYLGCPSHQDRTTLVGLMRQIQPRHLFSGVPFQLIRSADATSRLLKYATDAYFQYFSPFCPLFTRAGFVDKPRSLLLRLVVLRIGLQFLDPCSLNNELSDTLDRLLLAATVPSRLSCSLDTVQALMISVLGLHDTKMASRSTTLFYIASCYIAALGLHTHLTLESQLVLRMATLANFHFVLPRGFCCVSASHTIPRLPAPQDIEELTIQVVNSSNLEDLSSLTRLKLEFSRLMRDKTSPASYLYNIQRTLNHINANFVCNSQILYKNKHHPMARQLLLVMAIRSRFLRMQLLELACYTNLKCPSTPLLPQPDFTKPTAPARLGLIYAIQIVDLIALVSIGPYLFLRLCMLMNAARFIAQYFHAFANLSQPLINNTPNLLVLNKALLTIKSIITLMRNTPISNYEAHANFKIFQVLLHRHHINLPPSADPNSFQTHPCH